MSNRKGWTVTPLIARGAPIAPTYNVRSPDGVLVYVSFNEIHAFAQARGLGGFPAEPEYAIQLAIDLAQRRLPSATTLAALRDEAQVWADIDAILDTTDAKSALHLGLMRAETDVEDAERVLRGAKQRLRIMEMRLEAVDRPVYQHSPEERARLQALPPADGAISPIAGCVHEPAREPEPFTHAEHDALRFIAMRGGQSLAPELRTQLRAVMDKIEARL